MDQAVMVFDDDAARTSAIPSPSEGMVTYRSDDDVVEVFDGSAFNVLGGGLIETKTALKTDTFSASVTAGNNVAVTDLSITHEVADATNKVLLMAYFGVAANAQGFGNVGLAIHDGTSLIGVATSADDRVAVSAGGYSASGPQNFVSTSPHIHLLHSPGAGSKTYTVRAFNIDASTRTIFINRTIDDLDAATRSRGVSVLTLMEVSA
jgi:hypothetical protein